MRFILGAAPVFLMASSNVMATGAVSFEGSGYVLDFEVGRDKADVLAGVLFGAPGAASAHMLRPPQLQIKAFDPDTKTLLVRYVNPGDPALPPDFELAVYKSTGTLRLQGRSITGSFNWEM
ncbi:hypothetical protein [Polaromonas sp.]|uniref:hypothetical protein n=1 Tax=Polaromonas sp. TaxID=1869339 RepID=UPI003264205E